MQDRIVEHPNRYRLVPVSGEDNVFDLIPEPGEVTQEGTPLNKQNLLGAVTAQQLGFGTFDDPTVSEAFSAVKAFLDGKAPKDHKSESEAYGVGNDSQYGHLKLGDSTELASGADGGVAATPLFVKNFVGKEVPYKVFTFSSVTNGSMSGSAYFSKETHKLNTLSQVVICGSGCIAVLNSASIRSDLNGSLEVLFTTYSTTVSGNSLQGNLNGRIRGIAIGT